MNEKSHKNGIPSSVGSILVGIRITTFQISSMQPKPQLLSRMVSTSMTFIQAFSVKLGTKKFCVVVRGHVIRSELSAMCHPLWRALMHVNEGKTK